MFRRFPALNPNDDDETNMFLQLLYHYDHYAVRMTYEYFQDDLHHIVENLRTNSLLDELHSRGILDVEKYQSLENDRKTLARTLLQDIFNEGREAVIGLWVSLFVLQKSHPFPSLYAVLDELHHGGRCLIRLILLDEEGHQLPLELKDVQNCHKKHLCEKNEKITENKPPGCHQEEESFLFCKRYVKLMIVSTYHFRKRSENELMQIGTKHEEYIKNTQNELQHIYPNKIFRWCHRSRLVPQMVMVSGVPGVGKTTLMQKFVHDWTRGDLYQRFSFVFFFKFRELNRLDNISLETLILHQYPHLAPQLGNILQDPEKLLFIFDGLDESLHTMDFTSRHLCSNPKQPEPCGQIVVSLVRKSLLNGCSVLMTSRPTRLTSIDCDVFQRIVEIIGFFPEERQMYFEIFFSNHELAEKAFTYVKQNETLYTFCYLPSYCWIICTVLSRSFQPRSSDQPVSLLPKTVTQLFAIFIANILSNHSLHKSDAQQLLRSIGWMAEHGIMNHRMIFDNRDLDSFQVDNKSKLLSSFLMESDDPVSYSFLHITVQEFFSALVHYLNYSPEKLQQSLTKGTSYSDGRGEIFLRFLCGLSDNSTRSILSGYLDKRAAEASRDVITWVLDFSSTSSPSQSIYKNQHLFNTFLYLYETRNKALVLQSLKLHRRFDLSYVHMSALDCTVLAFILEICKNIEELDLSGCSLDIERLDRLAPVVHNLQNLRLAGNDLRDTCCIQLASIIRNNGSLKKLDLSNNRLFGLHFGDLMEALSSPNCRIEELRLDNNGLPDTSCAQLASLITKNQRLKMLNLSDNHLFGPHLGDLVKALSSPDCRIEELLLAGNHLSDTFCDQLASGIKSNKSLKKLDLSDNHLSGPHFNALLEALSISHDRIKEVFIGRNKLSEEEKEKIKTLVEDKPYMKIYY
ncbi:NACHT, LRR and PYD domains-containing protein 3-like [Anomaloglossus baeobatrachus]|uniref:NACHT, LRR and PYD domains-containing protein 3-like n=1 Tax=Anomaloglossus baeobatrachus TaxID=238106 RepID=UPI003F505010